MKKQYVMLVLFFVQSISAALQITENSAQRFSFTWEVDGLAVDDTSGDRSAISFKSQNVELGENDQPVIPAFSFYIGTPGKGNLRVSCTPLSTRLITLKHPLKMLSSKKRMARYPNLHFSNMWISDGQAAILGNISSQQFILKPFIYNEKTNSVQVLERASCTIEFSSSGNNAFTAAAITRAPSDYSQMVSKLMLNFDVASKWASPATRLKKRKIGEEFPLSPNNLMISFSIGDGHNDINEGTIKENGLIKIPGDILQKLGTTVPIQLQQIALYGSSKGEMPLTTPDISELPDGVTEIPLARFDLKGNGIVDPDDYVIAYVTGSSDWVWEKDSQAFFYNLNRYEDYRHYWITRRNGNGAILQPMPNTGETSERSIQSYKNHLLFKMSEEISHRGGNVERGEKSGLDWRWKLLSQSFPTFSYQSILTGIDTMGPVFVKIRQPASSGGPAIDASFSNASVCSLCDTSWYPVKYSGNHTLKIEGKNIDQAGDYIEIGSIEFTYEAKLDLSLNSGAMTVFSPETASTVRYNLSNLPGELVYIFRIDANENITLVDTVRNAKGSSYGWIDSAGKGIKYYICSESAIHPTPSVHVNNPQSEDLTSVYNLRLADNPTANKADYLIVSHPDFLDQAKRLAQHKRSSGRFTSPKVVDVRDVYREFSGGNLDPVGIRNFLLYAHSQWGVKPDYVVLLGKGHYNFKSINTSEPVFIPISTRDDRCYEDFFSYLEPGASLDSATLPVPSLFVGRFPCSTPDQARQMVDKIIDVEDQAVADLGAWRNRGLLVNDDNKQVLDGQVVPDQLGTDHRDASEKVGSTISSSRPAMDIRKVNLFQYPLNTLFQKPEARDALINEINGGVSFVNFFGHGSSLLWTDERILDVGMVANMHNDKRYPFISSFSCAVGEFDQPSPHRCLSEALALASKSGAIVTVSSTREAYSENNKQLAVALYKNMYDSSRVGVSLGQAYAEAKIIVRDQNSQIYSYLGDPSIRFTNPLHRVSIEVLDKTNRSLDTLRALQAITVRGTIMKKDQMSVDAGYGSSAKPAYVQISIFNPPVFAQRDSTGTDTIPGTPIFTGQLEVKNGVFEQSLHLPRNIMFRKPGAKVIAFSWEGFDNGIGYKKIVFNGTDSIGTVDTIGPTIALRPLYDDQDASSAINGKSINPLVTGKIRATLPFRCEVNVFDSSGIDVTGTGPDEGLNIEIEGVLSKKNINNKFRFDGGDYRKGNATIEFAEGELRAGTYTIWVSAQDLAGNITKNNFVLDVSQTEDIAINHVFNYPNPVKMGQSTTFYFNVSKTAGVTSSIKVYSMSGKLLRVFRSTHSGQVFNCRDEVGNLLGPNVYLYQLIVEDSYYQKTAKSKIQKLLIHPPR